ncbi:hypothetical protein BJ878DRAFT_532959 [Calycina marina]|uniref:Uncharacterized protein n=1 Tax=Calycina marina TaxID=1763456 RepID=A0A9P7Z794_9HELO|nr:hypothetical protein BJ878DRAFT_532959 [Calycina marina]
MKSFAIHKLVAFLPFIKALEAQSLLSFEDASRIAWRAYGNMVEQVMTAGQPLVKGKDFLFVTPPSTVAIRGGAPCPEAVTNNELFPFADSLQAGDSPLLDMAGVSYIQALDLYPTYNAYKNQMRSANAALQQYSLSVYGPAFNTLADQRTRIETRAQEQLGLEPGYNMPAYGGNYNVQINPFESHEITDQSGLCYKPLYSLTGGFEEAVDSWINGTGGQFSYTWSMKNVNGRDWSSLGHSTSVSQYGGGLFSILSARKGSSTEETQFDSWTSKFSESVSMTLTMEGGPLIFNIQSGSWEVPSVRASYPKITSNGINNLAGKVKLTKLMLGHQVSVTIRIDDTAQWKSVSQFISDAKKNINGGLRIFGFSFGAGSSGNVHRNITEIQTSDHGSGGVIVIPASTRGLPMLLGAYGKAV